MTNCRSQVNVTINQGTRCMGHNPKTNIIVIVVRLIPVAIRNTRIIMIVVPRAASQHTASVWSALSQYCPNNHHIDNLKQWFVHPRPLYKFTTKGSKATFILSIFRFARCFAPTTQQTPHLCHPLSNVKILLRRKQPHITAQAQIKP